MHVCSFFGRYGISDYTLTQKLVEHAKTFPPSFDPLAPRKYYYTFYVLYTSFSTIRNHYCAFKINKHLQQYL